MGLVPRQRQSRHTACPLLIPPGDWEKGKGSRLIQEISRFITEKKAQARELVPSPAASSTLQVKEVRRADTGQTLAQFRKSGRVPLPESLSGTCRASAGAITGGF